MTQPLILLATALVALYFTVAVIRRFTEKGDPMATALASVQLSRVQTADPTNTACDAINGNITVNTGATCFRFDNTDTASHTVTFTTILSQDGLALADEVVTIAGSATVWLSDFDVDTFGSQITYMASNALVKVTAFEP